MPTAVNHASVVNCYFFGKGRSLGSARNFSRQRGGPAHRNDRECVCRATAQQDDRHHRPKWLPPKAWMPWSAIPQRVIPQRIPFVVRGEWCAPWALVGSPTGCGTPCNRRRDCCGERCPLSIGTSCPSALRWPVTKQARLDRVGWMLLPPSSSRLATSTGERKCDPILSAGMQAAQRRSSPTTSPPEDGTCSAPSATPRSRLDGRASQDLTANPIQTLTGQL